MKSGSKSYDFAGLPFDFMITQTPRLLQEYPFAQPLLPPDPYRVPPPHA